MCGGGWRRKAAPEKACEVEGRAQAAAADAPTSIDAVMGDGLHEVWPGSLGESVGSGGAGA
jgi:hypothetical protein